jgi:hypothetical protein
MVAQHLFRRLAGKGDPAGRFSQNNGLVEAAISSSRMQ